MKPAPPPEELDAEERRAWWHTMGLLQELGTLDLVTAEELAEYCRALARMRQTVKQRDFDQFARVSATMLRFASKCGMTPASRARLGIVWTGRGWKRR